MLKTRIVTATVLLLLFCGALFGLSQNGWALALLLLLAACGWEWGGLAGWAVLGRSFYAVAMVGACAALWWFAPAAMYLAWWGAVLLWFVLTPLWLWRGAKVRSPLVMALVGLAALVPLWLALVKLHDRAGLMLILLTILWVSDTAAYACGRAWGKHKLAISISPGKTWEGFFGAAAAVTLYYGLLHMAHVQLPALLQGVTGLAVFLLLMILGVEGDLFESWVKRTAGVKDSGVLLPGHGGVLDRFDALMAAMPVAVLLLERYP